MNFAKFLITPFSQNTSGRLLPSFVNGIKIFQLKAKDSELNPYPVCLAEISKGFLNDNLEQTGLNAYVYVFSVVFEFWK